MPAPGFRLEFEQEITARWIAIHTIRQFDRGQAPVAGKGALCLANGIR